MKKFILLLIVPFLSFGQLSEDYISKGDPKAHGLNFSIKFPSGYNQAPVSLPTTLTSYTKKEKDINVSFFISVYTLEEIDSEQFKNKSKSTLKRHIESIEELEYYELCGYPGGVMKMGGHLQAFIFIKNKQFWIKVNLADNQLKNLGYIPLKIEDLFYKVTKSLTFF